MRGTSIGAVTLWTVTDAAQAGARDRDAIRACCDRWLGLHGPAATRPHAVLAELAAAAPPDLVADRYGEGSVLAELEHDVAELLGKEAAAFMPSGTMAQPIALRVWADRCGVRTVGLHPKSHLELHEQRAYQQLHGLHGRLVGDPNDLIAVSDLENIPERLAVLLLELPQREIGGRLPSWEQLCAQVEWARSRSVALHLDGARLWECRPFYGRSYAEIAGLFDTVYVSFYKGLGGIAGCCLAGPADVVAEARVWQARQGGRLISLYPYVLSARAGLEKRLPRMSAYHDKALEITAALAGHPDIDVVPDPPQTTMMHLILRVDRDLLQEAVLDIAEDEGIWTFSGIERTEAPNRSRVELSVGDATLGFTGAEVRRLLDRLVAGGR